MESHRLAYEASINEGNQFKVEASVEVLVKKNGRIYQSVQQDLVSLVEEKRRQELIAAQTSAEAEANRIKAEAELEQAKLKDQANEEKKRLEAEIYALKVEKVFPSSEEFTANLTGMLVTFSPVNVDNNLGYVLSSSVKTYSSSAGEIQRDFSFPGVSASTVFKTKQKFSEAAAPIKWKYCPKFFESSDKVQSAIVNASQATHSNGPALKSAVGINGAKEDYKCTSIVEKSLADTAQRLESYQFCFKVVSNDEFGAVLAPNAIKGEYISNLTGVQYSRSVSKADHPFFKSGNQKVVLSEPNVGQEVCVSNNNFFPNPQEMFGAQQ